jgi:hypothetical protein
LATGTLSLTGCFTLAKQAYNEARGAQGDVLPITDAGHLTLQKYRDIQFTPATTTTGSRLCPPALTRAYDRSANQLDARLKSWFPEEGGAPTLTVDSDVLYFQGKGMLSGAFMLTRVKLREGDQPVTEVMVRAESEAFRAGGEDALANASVDALGKFLKRYAPMKSTEKDREKERE